MEILENCFSTAIFLQHTECIFNTQMLCFVAFAKLLLGNFAALRSQKAFIHTKQFAVKVGANVLLQWGIFSFVDLIRQILPQKKPSFAEMNLWNGWGSLTAHRMNFMGTTSLSLNSGRFYEIGSKHRYLKFTQFLFGTLERNTITLRGYKCHKKQKNA